MNEFEPGFRLSDLYGVIRRRLPLIIVAVIGFGLFVARPTALWLSGRDEAS